MLKTVLKINIAFLLAAALLFLANTAAHAASYYFSPAVDSFVQGCVNEVVVMVDTAGVDSNAATEICLPGAIVWGRGRQRCGRGRATAVRRGRRQFGWADRFAGISCRDQPMPDIHHQ